MSSLPEEQRLSAADLETIVRLEMFAAEIRMNAEEIPHLTPETFLAMARHKAERVP